MGYPYPQFCFCALVGPHILSELWDRVEALFWEPCCSGFSGGFCGFCGLGFKVQGC